MPGQGEDFGRSENSRPVVPAAAHLPPALRRLRSPGATKFSPGLQVLQVVQKFSRFCLCLQVTIWGDYGRVEGSKVFMGVAQILLDNLDLSHIVIGWYKLFGTSSLVNFVFNTLNTHLSDCKGRGAAWWGQGRPRSASSSCRDQPHPPSSSSNRAGQDEALTLLLLLLFILLHKPPHPHQNHHFPYFHCISSPPLRIAQLRARRHKRVQKVFWRNSCHKRQSAGKRSSLPSSLFLLINTYYNNIDLDFHCECDTLFKT